MFNKCAHVSTGKYTNMSTHSCLQSYILAEYWSVIIYFVFYISVFIIKVYKSYYS